LPKYLTDTAKLFYHCPEASQLFLGSLEKRGVEADKEIGYTLWDKKLPRSID
jgi:hypothetical protein